MRILRNRKLNRLKGHDYSSPGYYFVTICTKNRVTWFGEIRDGEMVLNQYGEIVRQQWVWLKNQYAYVQLDEYIVMPNHIHGIISIIEDCRLPVGNGRDRSLREEKIKSISKLIGAFKTTSSKIIHQRGILEFQWQKSFYDHIIRNESDLNRIREYTVHNPFRWPEDRNHPDNLMPDNNPVNVKNID